MLCNGQVCAKLLIEGNSLLNTNPTKSMRLFQKARALGLKLDRPRDAMVIERMAVGYLSMAHFNQAQGI